MALVINTNMPSLNAQRNLSRAQNPLQTALQRLSSGMRINTAKDDAAGIGIASRMSAQIRGLSQASRNANNAISLTQTMEGGLDQIHEMLQRMRELAVQAADDSNQTVDRTSLNQEFGQLRTEIERIADSTKFNGQNVLNGGFGGSVGTFGASLSAANGIEDITSLGAAADTYTLTVAAGTASGKMYTLTDGTNTQIIDNVAVPTGLNSTEVNFTSLGIKVSVNAQIQNIAATNTFVVSAGSGTFQVGADSGTDNQITISGIDAQVATLSASLVTADLTTLANAQAAIGYVDTGVNQVNTHKGTIGAINNRLDYTVANLSNIIENLSSARSRITDADFAVETANMTKYMITQQAAISVLAQANQIPQQVLALLGS
ncbi:MAG: flagellin [Deltaproteobacteria bacterium]|nr:flagellin [Deltaproteobacteria bacterium]